MKFAAFASLLLASALMLPAAPALAQDDEDDQASVVVTGLRVRQGGAQDIAHFRSIAADAGMPRTESLSVEGLLGEHDLTLPASAGCKQMFCIVAETMPANLAARSADRMFAGVGFASNIDAKSWRRAPLDLIAVVDKSGSMQGEPLALVRASLLQIVGQMRDGDRIGIVLYGDRSHVHLAPTDIAGNRAAIEAAIRAIESAGSTNMEQGLRLGYDTALAEAPRFQGNTRVMLFTDEQPNVGRTDAQSFIGMAEHASRHGIGLTTIGVGVQFDGALANRVSAARGGNLFFISDEKSVETVFRAQLDTMVSELAHDLVLTMRPAAGYRVSGVFGVPDGAMEESPEGTITVTVPTVFLSTNGGGIFATVDKASDRADLPAAPIPAGQPLLDVAVKWHDAATGAPGSDRTTVAPTGTQASPALRKAHLLVDEYLAMREATIAFHRRSDPKTAYSLLNGLATRLKTSGLEGMDKEQKLVDSMLAQAALYSGYGGEQPKSLRHLAVVGRWRVVDIRGFDGVARGDTLEFTPDREMLTYRRGEGLEQPDESESYEINERELHLVNSGLVMSYAAREGRMTLRSTSSASGDRIALQRMD